MTYLEITSFDKQTSVTEPDWATKNNLFPSLSKYDDNFYDEFSVWAQHQAKSTI